MTRAEQAQKRAEAQASKAEAQARDERLANGQATPEDLEIHASELDEEASLLGEFLASGEATPEKMAEPEFCDAMQTLKKTIRQLRDIEGRTRRQAVRLRTRQEKATLKIRKTAGKQARG